MKHGMFLATLGAGALGLTACSQTVPMNGAAEPAASVSSLREPGWTASIKSVTESHFNVADSTRDRSYGSAQWSRGDRPTLSRVNLAFSYGGTERELSWAILFGSCGTASLPLIPISNFPELEVGGGGHAQVDATLSLELPTSGTYHIDIYRDRRGGAESLVGCGNLKYVSG
jgi:hypothetical protein